MKFKFCLFATSAEQSESESSNFIKQRNETLLREAIAYDNICHRVFISPCARHQQVIRALLTHTRPYDGLHSVCPSVRNTSISRKRKDPTESPKLTLDLHVLAFN